MIDGRDFAQQLAQRAYPLLLAEQPWTALVECIVALLRPQLSVDALVLLHCQGQQCQPLASVGLVPQVIGRRFRYADQPRLAAASRSQQPVLFSHDSPWPDPYDGLLLADHLLDKALPMHSCLAIPLWFEQQLHGIVTLDALVADAFTGVTMPQWQTIQQAITPIFVACLQLQHWRHQAEQSFNLLAELATPTAELIGQSVVMQQLRDDIQMLASAELTVLIQGETGVGKELVAQQLHLLSKRSSQPMVQVNCAALPETLVESELFGHRKGAFTGAISQRQGKFLVADGGTVFLDEVGELPLTVQAKLLRVLQSGELQVVGDDKVTKVDVRVIAATNRDLLAEVAAGRFRADLFHRLSVYPLTVPPLRQRGQDISLLANYFVEQQRRQLGVGQLVLSPRFLQLLQGYSWPGNVRELSHVISRAALKAWQAWRQHWRDHHHAAQVDGHQAIVRIDPEHSELQPQPQTEQPQLPVTERHSNSTAHRNSAGAPTAQPIARAGGVANAVRQMASAPSAEGLSLKDATELRQKYWISQALASHQYNWAAAARELQIDRANLVRLAKRLGIAVSKQLE